MGESVRHDKGNVFAVDHVGLLKYTAALTLPFSSTVLNTPIPLLLSKYFFRFMSLPPSGLRMPLRIGFEH
jgi:hypothetical protein